MSRNRLFFCLLLLFSKAASAQQDFNQTINQVVQEAVEIGVNTIKWDWEASGYGGYILVKKRI